MSKSTLVTLEKSKLGRMLNDLNREELVEVASYIRALTKTEDAKKTRVLKGMLKKGHKVNIFKGGEHIATGVIDRVKTKKALVNDFKYIGETIGARYDVPLSMIKVA
jgi:hypothetical protein